MGRGLGRRQIKPRMAEHAEVRSFRATMLATIAMCGGRTIGAHAFRSLPSHGRIANALAGNPRPLRTFGHVTTISAPLAGT